MLQHQHETSTTTNIQQQQRKQLARLKIQTLTPAVAAGPSGSTV
jgi:hypothetical protein